MGFYSLTGPYQLFQEAAPGSKSIDHEAFAGASFPGFSFPWTTTITFSTGAYGVYVSSLSVGSVLLSIAHPTKPVYTKTLSIPAGENFLQYINGDSQNIQISLSSVNAGSNAYLQISKIEEV